ncbi:MAG: GDP-mannose 4,6-dehydratase, partial [Beutenbergiaceae bacterium]
LAGDPLTIYGDGSQTRSFCYVSDLIDGIVAMIDSADAGPINLGNPEEFTVGDLADAVGRLVGGSRIEHHPLPMDDPTRRRPDIAKARAVLGWQPSVPLSEGLAQTAEWFRARPEEVQAARRALAGPQLATDEGSAA